MKLQMPIIRRRVYQGGFGTMNFIPINYRPLPVKEKFGIWKILAFFFSSLAIQMIHIYISIEGLCVRK